MASNTYRIVRMRTYDYGSPLIVPEIHLYSGNDRIDNTATITTNMVLSLGTTQNINDNIPSSIIVAGYTEYAKPLKEIRWVFPTTVTVDGIRLMGTTLSNYLASFELQELVNGSWERVFFSQNSEWLGDGVYSTLPTAGINSWDTLNPSSTNASYITLSDGDLVIYSSQSSSVKSYLPVSSGKIYVELTWIDNSRNLVLGMVPNQPYYMYYPGQTSAYGYGYNMATGNKIQNGSNTAYGPANATVVGMYVDVTAGTIGYIADGVDLGVAFSGVTFPLYVACGAVYTGVYNKGRMNFGGSSLSYLPSGYTGLGEKLLILQATTEIQPTIEDATYSITDQHWLYSGTHNISGNVYYNGQPPVPTKQLVRLYDQETGNLIDETLSNSSTGYYTFSGLADGEYSTIALDNTKTYESAVDSDIELVSSQETLPNLRENETYYDNVKLLLKFDDGGISRTLDSSKYQNQVNSVFFSSGSMANSAPMTSTSDKKYGASSMFSTGVGYLNVEGVDIGLHQEDFVVEGWYKGTASPTATKRLWTSPQIHDASKLLHGYLITSGSNVQIGWSINSSSSPFVSTTILLTKYLSEFTHIAFVRKTNIYYIVVDGVLKSTYTDSSNLIQTTAMSYLRIMGDGTYNMQGYMDDFCITVGTTKGYELGFTPAELYPAA